MTPDERITETIVAAISRIESARVTGDRVMLVKEITDARDCAKRLADWLEPYVYQAIGTPHHERLSHTHAQLRGSAMQMQALLNAMNGEPDSPRD